MTQGPNNLLLNAARVMNLPCNNGFPLQNASSESDDYEPIIERADLAKYSNIVQILKIFEINVPNVKN